MTASPDNAGAIVEAYVRQRLAADEKRPLIVGICGAQGSGKSTLSAAVAARLNDARVRTVVLSLDDLYLPYTDRLALAETVHPLLATRGVPGTHDVALGESLLRSLRAGKPVILPRFDKATDTRCPPSQGAQVDGPVDVVLFEGWCVGAVAQDEAALSEPVNGLERERDGDGRWRRYVNNRLYTDYRQLFTGFDALILLAAPGFEVVQAWRTQQEHDLRDRIAREGGDRARVMNDAQVAEFIQYYERLTRHILTEMPARADLVLRLDATRHVIGQSNKTS